MTDELEAMRKIQAPEDSEVRKRARERSARKEPQCPRCENKGVVVSGVNGSTAGKIGCRACGRGDDIVKRLRERRRVVAGATVVTRRRQNP